MWFENKPHSHKLYIPPAESASYKNKTHSNVISIPPSGRIDLNAYLTAGEKSAEH